MYFYHSECIFMVKDSFTIKDLENLTGIKIPTLRIWEKRYEILKPKRTKTGIRTYSIEEASYLLNIVFLNKNGWKISKIAKLTEKEIQATVKTTDSKNQDYKIEIEEFTISMLAFDQVKFNSIYNELLKKHDFDTVYESYFFPLLLKIGVLWQTNTIDIIHEHFISSQIIQKLIYNIERLSSSHVSTGKTYILFLPSNEIHEIGLRYIQYQLLKSQKQTIYLGNHTELDQLYRFKDQKNVELIANLTINPHNKSLQEYLLSIEKFTKETDLKVHLYGLQFEIHEIKHPLHENIKIFKKARDLIAAFIKTWIINFILFSFLLY